MPLPRKKSCYHCRLAKTRCNLAFPRCLRCVSRNLKCDYGNTQTSFKLLAPDRPQVPEPRLAEGVGSSRTTGDDAAPQEPPSAQEPENASGIEFYGLDEAAIDSMIPASIGAGKDTVPSLDWNLSTGSLWAPQAQSDLTTNLYSTSTDLTLPTTTFTDNDDETPFWLQQTLDLGPHNTELTSVPAASRNMPTPFTHMSREETAFRAAVLSSPPPPLNWSPWRVVPRSRPGLLRPLKHKNFSLTQMLTAKYVMGTMTSYPRMLLANSKAKSSTPLPPFIHAFTAIREEDCGCVDVLPEPLANCVSLLHMYETRTPASESFVWRSIFAEQERLYRECKNYSRPLLLAALQAITIYILLQAREGQHDEFATVVLVLTMGEMSLRLYKDGFYSPSELELSSSTSNRFSISTFNPGSVCNGTMNDLPPGLVIPSWGEWTYIESIRRTATLLFLINWLLDVDIGFFAPGECNGLDMAPLPAPRDVWEARTREEWEAAYKSWVMGASGMKNGKIIFLTVGMLRELDLASKNDKSGGELGMGEKDKAQKSAKSKVSEEEIEELGRWCAGVDGFGSMILMAALTARK